MSGTDSLRSHGKRVAHVYSMRGRAPTRPSQQGPVEGAPAHGRSIHPWFPPSELTPSGVRHNFSEGGRGGHGGSEGDQSAPLTPSGLTPSVPDPSRLTSPDPLIPLTPPAPLSGSGVRGVTGQGPGGQGVRGSGGQGSGVRGQGG